MNPVVVLWGGKKISGPELGLHYVNQIGSKAANLYRLYRWGFPVPPGFATNRMLDDYSLHNYIANLRSYCASKHLDSTLVAVRSSPCISMPGMLSTILNVELLSMKVDSPVAPLKSAMKKVFLSWVSAKAIAYRDALNIPHYPPKLGVIVQIMVNPLEGGCSGVMFTHNPISKTRRTMGEILPNDFGEALVGGKVKAQKLRWLRKHHPTAYRKLLLFGTKLVKATGKPQDTEFVVTKEGQIFLVQTRDMKFSTAQQIDSGKEGKGDMILKGSPGCQGLVEGTIVTTEMDIKVLPKPHILFRDMTTTDDFALMNMADAFVTSLGGPTCHAAIVARAMNKPCVVGMQTILFSGTKVCVDGKAGIVYRRKG